MFKNGNFVGDITQVEKKEIPDFEVLTAGLPCQPFSQVGFKKGFEDTRGTLFFDIAEIIKIKQPKAYFLENVRHVYKHDEGRTFSRIKKVLNELQPSYVLLELGGNDALRGYPPEKIYQNLMKMIEACKERGIEVFLMQIRILPNYGKRYQTKFESVYAQASKDSDVVLVPFMLQEIALKKDMMFSDGIHPNEKGVIVISKTILRQIKKIIK